MLSLEGSSEHLNIGDFAEVESLAKGRLPQIFKKIYLQNNGGYPLKAEFEGDEYIFSINGFNPIKFGRLSIESLIKDFCSEYELLVGFVPFAYDDGGNTFMLSVRGEDFGKVYLWLHDENRLEFVVSSFDNLVRALM